MSVLLTALLFAMPIAAKAEEASCSIQARVTDMEESAELHVREHASVRSRVVAKIRPLTHDPLVVNVVAARKGWIQIGGAFSVGEQVISAIGWIPTEFVRASVVGERSNTSQRLSASILTHPRNSSAAIGAIVSGTEVELLEVRCGWVKVAHGNQRGWLRSGNICTDHVRSCL